jgi:hypothetical protein
MNDQVPSDLGVRLDRAIRQYRTGWQPVDVELYDLCRRRASHGQKSDVYTKVTMIERVYKAGIIRSFRGVGDAETIVADGLIAQADLLEKQLALLKDRPFDQQTAHEIVDLHGRITKSLAEWTGNVWLTSFVSKYLHFHRPIVPIYDGNAAGSIGSFVSYPVHQRQVTSLRESMRQLPVTAGYYRNFVAAFVVLYERAWAETSLAPTVKEVDYLLWQG